jgi:sarcosine oxidase subunit beta
MYDASDDWMPIYDKSAIDGFYMAIGTSGNQFKNAGPAGKLMAEVRVFTILFMPRDPLPPKLIDGTETKNLDHDREPLQLELDYTGNTLNTAIFSRLRTSADSETSGSVVG